MRQSTSTDNRLSLRQSVQPLVSFARWFDERQSLALVLPVMNIMVADLPELVGVEGLGLVGMVGPVAEGHAGRLLIRLPTNSR